MATYEYTLPELGEGIEAGDVIQVLVAVGETIARDQSVLELETDKAVIEVPAPVSGIVQAIHVQAGEKAAVGQRILTLETAAATSPAAAPAPPPAPPAAAPLASPPTAQTPALPLETRPATADEAAEQESRAEAPVPAPPASRDGVGQRPPPATASASGAAPAPVPAAPSVRRLAREIGIDITAVTGSGPGGRISPEDIKNFARQRLASADDTPLAAPPVSVTLPDFTTWGAVERQPMTGIRRKTAEHMAHAWATIPHVTQCAKADITELEELRQRFAARAEAAGGKLTITAIMLKVVVAALKRFPQFNASVDVAREEVVYKKYYHIGVAVDTDRGLLVPVIRDVERKSIVELAVELTQVAERARQRKTTLEELQGGTFTVTNLGGIGGTFFSPIINAPEVAILGVARSTIEAVYRDGQFEPRLMLPLALSYDHRLIDGADGARFVQWVTETLQQPFRIALEG
jgi:pyruvate dehydrogenase E2 component (dihydrolipoamide acetyltransferase)